MESGLACFVPRHLLTWQPFGLSVVVLASRGEHPVPGARSPAMRAPPRQGNHSIELHCVKAARAIPYSVDRPVGQPASQRHCRFPFRHSRWLVAQAELAI